MSQKIRLNATEDVKEFVQAASKCDFDVDISYNRVIIDAKSILGILSMDRDCRERTSYGSPWQASVFFVSTALFASVSPYHRKKFIRLYRKNLLLTNKKK